MEYKTRHLGGSTCPLCSPWFTVTTDRTTDCKHAWYLHATWEGYYKSDTISLPFFLSFARITTSVSWWETKLSAKSTALWCGRCSTVSTDHIVWGYLSKPRSTQEQCHEDFAVLGQSWFCANSLLWGFNHKLNASVKLRQRFQMNFNREG